MTQGCSKPQICIVVPFTEKSDKLIQDQYSSIFKVNKGSSIDVEGDHICIKVPLVKLKSKFSLEDTILD